MRFENKKIKEFATVINGTTPSTRNENFWDGNINWITPAELIDGHNGFIHETARKITPLAVENKKLKMLPKGTVLLTSRAPIGKVALVGEEMCTNQGFKSIICDEVTVSPKYLYYWLLGKKDYLNSLGRGATFKEISKSIVENIEIPIPTLVIQAKIVDLIEKVLELIEKRKQQITALSTLKQSVFLDMFGDPVDNPKKWKTSLLGEKIKIIGGFAFKSREFVEKGIPVIKIGTVNKGYFDMNSLSYMPDVIGKYDKYKVYPGDLLMSLTGTVGKEDYGNVCIVPNSHSFYLLNQRVAKITSNNELDSTYLEYCFKHNRFKKGLTSISRGIRQANISNKDINSLAIPIPPIELQREFANIVWKIDTIKDSINNSLSYVETLFQSLTQKAFKGELFNNNEELQKEPIK